MEVEADTANEEAIERSNELAARVGTVESKLDALTASMDELHSDVRRLLAQQQQGASVQEEKPPAPMTRRRRKPSSRASAASACSSGPGARRGAGDGHRAAGTGAEGLFVM